jgi:molybdopterin synthase catalytic subunit
MPVTVLYFAAAREAAGTPREALAAPPATVGDLRAALVAAHPRLARILPRCRIAVDQAFADDAATVRDGAEIAVVPPVAGGAPAPEAAAAGPGPRFAVVERPLALSEVVDAVSARGLGGIVTFTGTVRDASRGRRVTRLEYEAYVPMAERSLARIGEEVGREHGAEVAIVHRVGVLAPGEAAVVIAAAAAHRTPAFRACEACIERLKRDVPIWKREVFDDGSEWVGMGP